MKIGVDASCWLNRRGFGRYTRELLRALLTLDQQNEYWFFLDAETARESIDFPEQHLARRVIVDTSRAASRAASASGHRTWQDLWKMARAVNQHGRELDVFFFPAVYTFFPLSTSARVVVAVHDTTAERFPELIFPNRQARMFWWFKLQWALRQASMVVTVSESARRDIVREFGARNGMVKVVPDAVGPEFHPVEDRSPTHNVLSRYGLDGTQRLLLYVGGISPHKNLATLVDAFASLSRQETAGLTLVLVGDFKEDNFYSSYPAVREHLHALGVGNRVVFAGFVPDEELLYFYNAAECLVLPSFSEGFGLPALEAMACGTPVVASAIDALVEVVGDAGLFFNPHSPRDLEARLRQVVSDQPLRTELGRRGVQRAKEFSWERSARAALEVFQDLVNGS